MTEENSGHSYFRIGSMTCQVQEKTCRYAKMLAHCYSVSLIDQPKTSFFEVNLSIEEKPEKIKIPQDNITVTPTSEGYFIETDPVNCSVQLLETKNGVKFLNAAITIRQPDMKDDLIGYHLWIIVNRMLLMIDAIIIHAAAIELDGVLNMFCGHKGGGKSTLSVFLGQQGAKILAEDRIILRLTQGQYQVSGCSSKMKIMAKSEEYLLADQLKMERTMISNIPKKVFEAKDFFNAIPHVDFRPERIIFNQVGQKYQLNKVKKNDALLKMIDRTADIYRFSNQNDYISFFNFCTNFIKQIDCYQLELSPNLEDLPLLLKSLTELNNRQ